MESSFEIFILLTLSRGDFIGVLLTITIETHREQVNYVSVSAHELGEQTRGLEFEYQSN